MLMFLQQYLSKLHIFASFSFRPLRPRCNNECEVKVRQPLLVIIAQPRHKVQVLVPVKRPLCNPKGGNHVESQGHLQTCDIIA